MTHLEGVGLIFVLSGVGVFADWALKVASGGGKPYVSGYFWLGAVVYMLTAFLWVPVMKSHKLAVLGAYYSVATTLLLAAVGILVFREGLSGKQWAGVVFAIVSVVLFTQVGDEDAAAGSDRDSGVPGSIAGDASGAGRMSERVGGPFQPSESYE